MFIFLEADPGCIMEELYKTWVPKLTDNAPGLGGVAQCRILAWLE